MRTGSSIGESAFSWCDSLASITIPNNLASISSETFTLCIGLVSVTIPDSVTSIGARAFSDCENLKEVYYSGTKEQWAQISIEEIGNEKLLSATIHYTGSSDDPDEPDTPTPPPSKPEFTDVPAGAFYADAVAWAVNNDITSGTGAGKFSPDDACTREQIATFLWRAAGKPEPTTTANPFTDVSESSYAYKAVLWAVENNITTGTGAGTFSPKNICTRDQAVTFLWRANGKPEPVSSSSFTDVVPGSYYEKAVGWAVENGITTGVGPGKFNPGGVCTRGHIVTFLYRDSQ